MQLILGRGQAGCPDLWHPTISWSPVTSPRPSYGQYILINYGLGFKIGFPLAGPEHTLSGFGGVHDSCSSFFYYYYWLMVEFIVLFLSFLQLVTPWMIWSLSGRRTDQYKWPRASPFHSLYSKMNQTWDTAQNTTTQVNRLTPRMTDEMDSWNRI